MNPPGDPGNCRDTGFPDGITDKFYVGYDDLKAGSGLISAGGGLDGNPPQGFFLGGGSLLYGQRMFI